MFRPIKRDANRDAVTGVDTTGAIARQAAERTGRDGKHRPAANVNDGRHQLAVLEDGERVLTPQEAEAYRRTHGAKEPTMKTMMPKISLYDDGGDVKTVPDAPGNEGKALAEKSRIIDEFKNSQAPAVVTTPAKTITPSEKDKVNPKAKFGDRPGEKRLKLDDFPRITPVYDEGGDVDAKSAPADFPGRVQIIPDDVQPVLATETDKAAAQSPHPSAEPSESESTEALIPERGTPEERAAIKTDKQQAMGQGTNGFVKLGTALIHERNLEPSTSDVTGLITERPTAGLPKIAAPTQEFHQETAGGPLISGAPSTDDKSTRQDFASMERKAKLTQYDQRIQQARDAGDETTADKLTVAKAEFQKANGWGTEGNHPGILGKIGHYASEVGNIAGDIVNPNVMALIPGTKLNRAIKEGAAFNRIAPDTEADQREATANTKESPKPKLLPGEGNTAATPDGTRYQRYEMPDGSTAWAKEGEVPRTASSPAIAQSGLPQISLPTSGGLPAGAVVGKPAGESKAETREQHLNRYAELKNLAESGAQLGDQDQKEFNTLKTELTVPKATIDSYNKQIDAALHAANVDKSLWSNYHALPGSTAEEAKQAIADAKAFSGETYQQGAEGRTMDKEERAQERKDKATVVYAEDENGQLIKTNKFDADKRGLVAEEMKAGDISKDRSAIRQLNDVQTNVNRYEQAIAKDLPRVSDDDRKRMTEIMALEKDSGGGLITADAGGKGVSINGAFPKWSAALSSTKFDKAKEDLEALSPEAKSVMNAYLRTAASVPTYLKALAGIGRSNKETLGLELANVPLPWYDAETARGRMQSFQDNVDQAKSGFPNNLPGMKLVESERSKSNKPLYAAPKPEEVEKSGTYQGKPVFKLKKGSTVYADGSPVEVK